MSGRGRSGGGGGPGLGGERVPRDQRVRRVRLSWKTQATRARRSTAPRPYRTVLPMSLVMTATSAPHRMAMRAAYRTVLLGRLVWLMTGLLGGWSGPSDRVDGVAPPVPGGDAAGRRLDGRDAFASAGAVPARPGGSAARRLVQSASLKA